MTSEQTHFPQANSAATHSAYDLTPDQNPTFLLNSHSQNPISPVEPSDLPPRSKKNQNLWEDASVIQPSRRGTDPDLASAQRTRQSEQSRIDRDQLTGLHRSQAETTRSETARSEITGDLAQSDPDRLTGSRSRAAGLPYPGRLLRYVPGQPLRFDRAALQWQTRMRERGWSIQADGLYGADSARICRQFQRAKGLAADGVVGPATWTATFRNDVLTQPQPGATSRINQRGLDLVKSFEGLSLRAYRDPVGIWTIGYGHTGPEVGPGDVITKAQAEALLRRDLTRFETGVRSLVKVPLTSNQFSALVSFAFNVGTGALTQSTLLARLNQRDYSGAANEFSRWVYGGGQVLPGLVRRREAEKQLFLA